MFIVGSRTIRTEEAVLITLSCLSDKVAPNNPAPEFKLKDLIAQSEDTGHSQHAGETMKRKNNKIKRKKAPNSELSGEHNSFNNNVSDNDMSRFD